jgi:hypothetical protein
VRPVESIGPLRPYNKFVREKTKTVASTYVYRAKVASCSVPNRLENPSPEDSVVEVSLALTCAVDLRVLVNVLIVHVLLNRVRKETLPGCPDSVVEHRQLVRKEDLS